MIGSLSGRIVDKQPPTVMIECNGVGYEVETPMSTFLDLPGVGQEAVLLTHLAIRDDAHVLYGFRTADEKQLFRLLIRVSGVGAKMALAVLSAMSAQDFARCIQFEDAASLVKVPGIGKKTAERLIVEMRDRISDAPGKGGSVSAVRSTPRGEAVDALIALGYKPGEVGKLIDALDIDAMSAEDIIRSALKQAAN